jgi:hypothetical protein
MARETMAEMLRDAPAYDATPRPKMAGRNNTLSYYRDGRKVLRLHHTDIAVWSEDGATVQLYTGGWQTVTTKERLNSFFPCRIFSDRGIWYISHGVPFFEGIEIDSRSGKIIHLETAAKKAIAFGTKQRSLAKQIEGFVKKIHVLPELPQPNGGDCWLCSMFDASKLAPVKCEYGVGNSTGQKVSDPDHLLEHIKEGYLHGSLIVNAMRWAGYEDRAIGYWFSSHKRDKDNGSYHGRSSVPARVLRRFLRSQLGLST